MIDLDVIVNVTFSKQKSTVSLRWNNTSSLNGWPLIKVTVRFIKRILLTRTFDLLQSGVDKVPGL